MKNRPIKIVEGRDSTIANPLFVGAGVVQEEGTAGSGKGHRVFPHSILLRLGWTVLWSDPMLPLL